MARKKASKSADFIKMVAKQMIENTLPPTDIDAAKRMLHPIPGQYGMSKAVSEVGQPVVDSAEAIEAGVENFQYFDNPYADAAYKTAVLTALPPTNSLQPESIPGNLVAGLGVGSQLAKQAAKAALAKEAQAAAAKTAARAKWFGPDKGFPAPKGKVTGGIVRAPKSGVSESQINLRADAFMNKHGKEALSGPRGSRSVSGKAVNRPMTGEEMAQEAAASELLKGAYTPKSSPQSIRLNPDAPLTKTAQNATVQESARRYFQIDPKKWAGMSQETRTSYADDWISGRGFAVRKSWPKALQEQAWKDRAEMQEFLLKKRAREFHANQ